MMKEELKKIARLQKEELSIKNLGIKRSNLDKIGLKIPYAIILSGVRQCGKSTLLRQLIEKTSNYYYFNFEDPRAFNFGISDFEKLDEVFHEEFGDCNYYFFDEIQNITEWERFVRQKIDLGKKFIITGSNASLLSKELGTRLTGRHLTYELFPFSYEEFLVFKSKTPSISSFKEYFDLGGFPGFLKYKDKAILQELFNDILLRDIVARYSLKESKTIKELSLFLLSNSGKEFSYNNLAKYFDIGSTNTVIAYISYLENSYLIFTVSKFDYSYKKQIINPKKIYSIDSGLSNANTVSFSEDKGRVLENLVFLHLRRNYKEIYYFKGKNECDFLIKEKGELILAVQVCYELNKENLEREIKGLKEAIKELKIKKGIIITFDQEDKIEGIELKPAWKWIFNI